VAITETEKVTKTLLFKLDPGVLGTNLLTQWLYGFRIIEWLNKVRVTVMDKVKVIVWVRVVVRVVVLSSSTCLPILRSVSE